MAWITTSISIATLNLTCTLTGNSALTFISVWGFKPDFYRNVIPTVVSTLILVLNLTGVLMRTLAPAGVLTLLLITRVNDENYSENTYAHLNFFHVISPGNDIADGGATALAGALVELKDLRHLALCGMGVLRWYTLVVGSASGVHHGSLQSSPPHSPTPLPSEPNEWSNWVERYLCVYA